jgi:hypothetical protein
MLETLKDVLRLPLLMWFVLVAVPCFIVYVTVLTQSLITFFAVSTLAIYPMYRIIKKQQDSQAEVGDNKVYLDPKGQNDAIDYLKKAKEKRDQAA